MLIPSSIPRQLFTLTVLACLGTAWNVSYAIAADDNAKAIQLLRQYCGDCHEHDSEGGIDYIDSLDLLLKRKKITPGNPDRSRVWLRIADKLDPMPPEGMDAPTAEERQFLQEWIESLGARQPEQPIKQVEQLDELTTVSRAEVVAAVYRYLRRLPREDRLFKRFFVLQHLHNKEVAAGSEANRLRLQTTRAAVAKTLNSLTWAAELVLPKSIDDQQTVMAFDLRDVEWDRRGQTGRPDMWNILSESYPYALDFSQNEDFGEQFEQINEWTRTEIPWIRADWFVATATQPQYYHALLYDAVFPELRTRTPVQGTFADNKFRLEQPMSQEDLLRWVRVDLEGNLMRSRAKRAAFTRSGVSSQPRMVERHAAAYGYLWNSYDFKKGSDEFMNLNARPLGPRSIFSQDRFEDQTFDHDGGEMIFGLPNGLHGFLLVDGVGKRITFGPTDVVEDRAKTLGNGMIVNGLSCIACHKNGLIDDFQDEVRAGVNGLPRDAKRIARRLFVDRADLDPLIERDQERYRRAAIDVLTPYLDASLIDEMKDGGQLLEPVGPVAKQFLVNTIDLQHLAWELDVAKDELARVIEFDPKLKRLGLAAVAQGGKLNRELWQSGAGTSMFQKVARALELGVPTAVMAENWRGSR